MVILAIGPLWRGSNAGGLFRALSREGCLIEIVDEFYYISLQTKKKFTKVLERVIRPLQTDEFNTAIKKKIVFENSSKRHDKNIDSNNVFDLCKKNNTDKSLDFKNI